MNIYFLTLKKSLDFAKWDMDHLEIQKRVNCNSSLPPAPKGGENVFSLCWITVSQEKPIIWYCHYRILPKHSASKRYGSSSLNISMAKALGTAPDNPISKSWRVDDIFTMATSSKCFFFTYFLFGKPENHINQIFHRIWNYTLLLSEKKVSSLSSAGRQSNYSQQGLFLRGWHLTSK